MICTGIMSTLAPGPELESEGKSIQQDVARRAWFARIWCYTSVNPAFIYYSLSSPIVAALEGMKAEKLGDEQTVMQPPPQKPSTDFKLDPAFREVVIA